MASGIRIGEVARQTGLSPDTLRHYGRLGLLPELPRTSGGARRYPEGVLRRVQVIQAALAVGFTLKELSFAFAERRAGRAPCRRVRALAKDKLLAIDRPLLELGRLREALQGALSDWDSRLTAGEPAGLLDSLGDVPITTKAHETPRRTAR